MQSGGSGGSRTPKDSGTSSEGTAGEFQRMIGTGCRGGRDDEGCEEPKQETVGLKNWENSGSYTLSGPRILIP